MTTDDLSFLAELVAATTAACRVPPGGEAVPGVRNELGYSVYCPGGRGCYPAIWVQDFTMIFNGGYVSDADGLNHLRLFLGCQNGPEGRALRSGAWIPPHAIADHILLDGRPVFYPGTYSAGEDQGGEPWGIVPPVNNHYDVIWLAHMLWSRCGDGAFLREEVNGLSVYERLTLAYGAPSTDAQTGLVVTTPEKRAVGFIFCDSIYMTGTLLMASLLRYRASRQLAELARCLGCAGDADFFGGEAARIARHIPETFVCPGETGVWLRACTGVSAQPDVWGSIYAVYMDVLPIDVAAAVRTELAAALQNGRIEEDGAIRHVPIGCDASAKSAWERTQTPHNRYQNGAFWHMPTGWLVAVLAQSQPELANALATRFVKHMRDNAFTKGEAFGAPWECIGWNGEARQNPVFAACITMPFAALKK